MTNHRRPSRRDKRPRTPMSFSRFAAVVGLAWIVANEITNKGPFCGARTFTITVSMACVVYMISRAEGGKG